MRLERLRGSSQNWYRKKVICDYWAVRPALKRAIVGRLDSLGCNRIRETAPTYIKDIALTGDVLIPPEWSGDHSLVCEHDGVRQSGREHALQDRDGGVKDNTTLATILDSGMDLVKVDEVGTDVMDIVL